MTETTKYLEERRPLESLRRDRKINDYLEKARNGEIIEVLYKVKK